MDRCPCDGGTRHLALPSEGDSANSAGDAQDDRRVRGGERGDSIVLHLQYM